MGNGYYIVFTGRKWKNAIGERGISWDLAGVWQAESNEHACLVACQDTGAGTAVAIEGFAWGVDTVEANSARRLGVELDPVSRLERMGSQLAERLAQALPAPATIELESGDDAAE